MSRKFEAINLMALYAKGSHNGWNEFLNECLANHDINRLAKVKYQIQAGMDDLAKGKLNTSEIDVWFVRLCKSIEDTAKKIIRQRHPLPGDNPLLKKEIQQAQLDVKRKRDYELAKFLRDSSY
jgi:hypothetical protein